MAYYFIVVRSEQKSINFSKLWPHKNKEKGYQNALSNIINFVIIILIYYKQGEMIMVLFRLVQGGMSMVVSNYGNVGFLTALKIDEICLHFVLFTFV
jgi:hypothetical protein